MGLRSWLFGRSRRAASGGAAQKSAPAEEANAVGERPSAPARPEDSGWQELPAYLPVDPSEHKTACVIASAIAAGDHPASEFSIKRVSIANPEYRRVAVIATAVGAAARKTSSFTVKRIYKHDGKDNHAA